MTLITRRASEFTLSQLIQRLTKKAAIFICVVVYVENN